MKILLSTVWHTGSEYVRKELRAEGHNVTFQHCEAHLHQLLKRKKDFDRIITTFRDPMQVGASWANRYDLFSDHKVIACWYELWTTWAWLVKEHHAEVRRASLFSGPKVNSSEDVHQLYSALRDGDMDYYHEFVPHDMIDWAWKEVAASGVLV